MNSYVSDVIKVQAKKIFWISVGWVIVAVMQFLIGYSTLLHFNCDLGDASPYLYLMGSIFTGVLAGILGGSGVVFLWERWLRTKNYGWALFSICWSYTLIYVIVSVASGLFVHSQELELPFYSQEVIDKVMEHRAGLPQMQSYVFWLIIVLGTLVILQVNDKYGPGVFRDFLLGKYFHPKREERIFMFLDLRSSTAIAEQLGEERYFRFLNDVFKHTTPSILYTKGEIYQYVGDETVISWKMDKGTHNANCLRCFFEVQQTLRKQAQYFNNMYGILPEFKAGLHYGYVMAGEIGVVKRDIAFSGDVLNTAARIQSKCNELGVNILLSEFLLTKLSLPAHSYEPKKIGDMALKGKEHKIALFTI